MRMQIAIVDGRILAKAGQGYIKPGHKYIKREGSPGAYKYTYPGEGKTKTDKKVFETAVQRAINILTSRKDEGFYSSLLEEKGAIPLPKAALQRRGFGSKEVEAIWGKWDVFTVAVIQTLHKRKISPDSLLPYAGF